MPRFEQRDDKGALTETIVITDATLRADPTAMLTSWSSDTKARPRSVPEGYDHIASVEGNPDALQTGGMTHYYAKSGSYDKEKPSRLAGLKAVVAEAEAKKVEEPAK